MRKLIVIILALLGSVGTITAIASEYSRRNKALTERIVFKAEQLRDATFISDLDSSPPEVILDQLKDLIDEYEQNLAFAQSPYPGEILLGTTPGGHSTWLETLTSSPYDGFVKEIRIRRTAQRPHFIRINDIVITGRAPNGDVIKETFNKNGRVKLYPGGLFAMALPRPMKVRRVSININHVSTGLQIYGIPYNRINVKRHTTIDHHPREPHTIEPPVIENPHPSGSEILLGTTPSGDSTWLETLCTTPPHTRIKEIRLQRTGSRARYLRINDIEITYLTPQGRKKELFNQSAMTKLYSGKVFALALPRPMRIARIRVLIGHKSTGLKVIGVVH
jgi:hypothetical protein